MAEVGIFHEDDPVELIEGELIHMAAVGGDYINCVNDLNETLVIALQGRARVGVQNPLQLSDNSEPGPDIVILQPRLPGASRRATPHAPETLLVIEVADSSPVYDRRTKVRLYAEAGIPETWIANLKDRRFEVYRDPVQGVYQTRFMVESGKLNSPATFPDIMLDVAALLGDG